MGPCLPTWGENQVSCSSGGEGRVVLEKDTLAHSNPGYALPCSLYTHMATTYTHTTRSLSAWPVINCPVG